MSLAYAQAHRWSVAEFERLHELGMLPPGRLELIEGEIVTLPPMNTPHGNAITRGNNRLVRLFGETHWVRVQCPFNVLDFSQPEPDFALIPIDSLGASHPTAADLLLEVSDTSLAYDREKAGLYARAGVADYWILDLNREHLEIRRNPRPDRRNRYGFSYRSVTTLERASPLFREEVTLGVADFLQ